LSDPFGAGIDWPSNSGSGTAAAAASISTSLRKPDKGKPQTVEKRIRYEKRREL
jgi:hypothetical protein